MKSVVCSYTWSRGYAQHVLAESAKVEVSSSLPARLKEPALEPGSFNLMRLFKSRKIELLLFENILRTKDQQPIQMGVK